MAGLVYSHSLKAVTVTGGADHIALLRVEAPANQKVRVRFKIFGKSGTTHVAYTVRRGSATTGGSVSTLTATKRSGMDTETVQGVIREWSSQPTDKTITNGTVIDTIGLTGVEKAVTQTYLVNGGETLTLWGLTGTTTTADVTAECEE